MLSKKTLKKQVHHQLNLLLNKKIRICQQEISSIKEARNNDTKSSAGDKYETGREMAQMELNKNEASLSRITRLKKELSSLPLEKTFHKIDLGSLVLTNQDNYYISFGIGKIVLLNQEYHSISLASPIAKVLLGKKIGDTIVFQNRIIIIQDIL